MIKTYAAAAPKRIEQQGETMFTTAKPGIAPVVTTNGQPLVDEKGNELPPVKQTVMTKFDKAASEPVTLSRGTIWLLATGLVLLGVIFSYGGSLLTWAREDQAMREKAIQTAKDVEEMRRQMDALKVQFDDIQKILQAQAVRDAEARGKALGYDVGRTDNKAGH